MDKALTDCNHTEHKHARGKPYGRFQLFQDDVRGDLKYNVGHEEDCQSSIVLVPNELQIGDQTIDGSIRNVGAVQEGQQVENRQDGNYSKVYFGDELSFT